MSESEVELAMRMRAEVQMKERVALLFRNVRENARCQSTAEHRENYLRSCEAHQGDLMDVVKQVRTELL